MLNNELNLSFNYEPITYGEIKEGEGKPIGEDTQRYRVLGLAKESDKSMADVYIRIGEKTRCFNNKIIWDNDVLMTIAAHCCIMRGKEKRCISDQDIINASTFPSGYDFCSTSKDYICGMSVPPIMTKRIVTRLIESGVFNYDK